MKAWIKILVIGCSGVSIGIIILSRQVPSEPCCPSLCWSIWFLRTYQKCPPEIEDFEVPVEMQEMQVVMNRRGAERVPVPASKVGIYRILLIGGGRMVEA
jgi:hypothetical protein